MPNPLTAGGSVAPPELPARGARPRLLPTVAVLAVIAACVAAGEWQRDRMHAKQALRAQLDATIKAEPVALVSLPDTVDWTSRRYLPVVATGEYLARKQILIDNKVVGGRAGFHVVTPLALADGRLVLVNRGWVAQGASRAAPPDAPPPAGAVSVRGRIAIPAARYLELQPEAMTGPIWQNLDPARFTAATGVAVLPAIVEAAADPAAGDGLVREWPAPDVGVETHRIYMVQWYAFALLAFVLWLWFSRRGAARGDDG